MAESKGFIAEFREFISRGNVIDLAVGVIIGGAFQGIVNSLVNDIVMPLVGIILGGLDFSQLSFGFLGAQIMYGTFISACLNFFILAIVIFCIVKALNAAHDRVAAAMKKDAEEEAKEEEAAAPSDEVLLLTEIRDWLQSRE